MTCGLQVLFTADVIGDNMLLTYELILLFVGNKGLVSVFFFKIVVVIIDGMEPSEGIVKKIKTEFPVRLLLFFFFFSYLLI